MSSDPTTMTTFRSWSDPIQWNKPSDEETIILMVRHGQTFGNDATDKTTWTYTGCTTDFPLDENGNKQADGLGEALADLQKKGAIKVSKIFSSLLKRAIQTGEHIKKGLDLPPIEKIENLREIHWGIADGKNVAEMDAIWDPKEEEAIATHLDRKKLWDYLPVFPESEKFNQILGRVMPELEKIAEANKGNVVIVVSHGRVLKTLMAEALNMHETEVPYPKNCGAAVFKMTSGKALEMIEIRS